jgi:DNA-binding transcriptional LysR family regulator
MPADRESAVARQPAMHAAVLRYIREVARRGSIRKAADVLHVASSAINRQILKLEADLGVRLFDRMPDGMRLTPAGEVLLRHVRDTLSNYDRLLAEIDELRGLRSGHVRIASLDSLLVDFLPRILGDFSAQYPAITFSVQAVAPMAVFEAIIAAEADIGLTFVAPTSPAVGLATSVPMPIGVVMAPTHPLAKRKVLDFADVAGHPVLLQRETLPQVQFIDDDYAAFRSSVQPRFVSNSIEMLRQVIRAGLGVAFFTRLGFLREIESGELVWIPLGSLRLERLRLGLFTPAQRTLSPATVAVAKELAARLLELG